jgi:hypothetical protein
MNQNIYNSDISDWAKLVVKSEAFLEKGINTEAFLEKGINTEDFFSTHYLTYLIQNSIELIDFLCEKDFSNIVVFFDLYKVKTAVSIANQFIDLYRNFIDELDQEYSDAETVEYQSDTDTIIFE